MATINLKNARVFFRSSAFLLDGGIRVEGWTDITDQVESIQMEKQMPKYAIRKIHAPLLDIAKVHRSILDTNPSWTRSVDYNSLFYAVVVECENKPSSIGNIEWIELREI